MISPASLVKELRHSSVEHIKSVSLIANRMGVNEIKQYSYPGFVGLIN